MLPYLFLCILPVILSVLFPGYDTVPKQRKKFLFFCAVAMIIILGLRSSNVGSSDTNNYYRMMARAINASSWGVFYYNGQIETGFQWFVYGLSRVLRDPQWILIISSMIIVICNLYSISKNTNNLVTAIVMFVTLGLMTFEMQAMRQAIAMSICLLAYEEVKKKNIIKFLFIVFLALFFHRTAVVFIPVYFLSKLKVKTNHLVIFGIASSIILFFSTQIITIANNVFHESYDTAVDKGGFVATSIYILIMVYALISNRESLKNDDKALAFYVLLTGMVCYIMRYVGALAAERVSFYYMFAQIIVLSDAIENTSSKNKKLVAMIVFFLCILLFIYRMSTSNLVPYHFFTYN